jgi:endonuclease-3
MFVTGFPGHQSGETLASTIDEIEPQVIRQRAMTIGPLCSVDQVTHCGDVIGLHLAFDVEDSHEITLPLGFMVEVERRERARTVARRLKRLYPDAVCELSHRNAFELLAATILSAQCTDVRVNMVTPALFAAYPDAPSLARADRSAVEEIIRSTGFYQSKAKNLIGMAQSLVDRFDGEVPHDLDDLVTLPGVGRKTGNVVRSVVFGLPGLPVDTHVGRLSRRLGLTDHVDPVKVERELNSYLPGPQWGTFSLRLILHGRRVCDARKPRCGECTLADICPSAGAPVDGPTTKRRARTRP